MMNPQPRYLSVFASYRKQILIGLGIGAVCALVVFAALFFTSGAAVTALSLQGDALLGSDAQAEATVRDTGLLPVHYHAVLLADGKEAASKDVTIKPGEEMTVTLQVPGLSLGAHTLQLGEAKAEIKVLRPADFTVKSLDIQPQDIKPGDDVTVTAVVDNTGDVKGSFSGSLLMDLTATQTLAASIDAGGEQTVSAVIKAVQRGSHSVTLGSQTMVFAALAPADIQLQSFSLGATYAQPGQTVDATIILANNGDVDGTYSLTMLCNDAVYKEQNVDVGANDTVTIHIDVSANTAGSYDFVVGDQRNTLQIVQISRPKTGALLVKKANGGICYLTIENDYSDKDVIVTLVSTSNPTAPVLMVYVRAGEKTGKIKIKNGTYLEYYTYGSDMDSTTRKFMADPNYGKFDDVLTFKTYKTYSGWYVYTHYAYYESTFGGYGSGAMTSSPIDPDQYPN